MGLITPDQGTVSIDGVALTNAVARRWREHVGYVAPDTFLFHDTIRANLEWARPEVSPAEIDEAIAIADADQFINALPQGLDTIIGDRGVALSQGERQRIALARAMLRRPKLLVLDEATNNLDSASETRVLDALKRSRTGTTALIIAHRIATVRWADLIYVIEDGRVVEFGDWDSLSARPAGRFRAMREAQELGS